MAAVLTAASAEFTQFSGTAVTIECVFNVLSVASASCAAAAQQINAMAEQYLGVGGGVFHNCEVTSTTTTTTSTTTTTTTTTCVTDGVDHDDAAESYFAAISDVELGDAITGCNDLVSIVGYERTTLLRLLAR